MQDPRAPHFIIIGAVKAATTWTARNLSRNPALFLPGPEPHYFSTEFHRGYDWYQQLFAEAPDDAVIGEKSADYLAHPAAAGRIAERLPQVRLVVQLRNPIDRAYSDYCMLYRRGTVREKPEAYFSSRANDEYRERFLKGGLYAEHLSRYYDCFAPEQILVILYDDIQTRPDDAIRRICAHIGVELVVYTEELVKRENDSAAPLLPLAIRKTLRPFKKAAAPLRGRPWFETVRGALARRIDYPPLSPEVRRYLREFYAADIESLSRLIGRDLSFLLRSPEAASSSASAPGEA